MVKSRCNDQLTQGDKYSVTVADWARTRSNCVLYSADTIDTIRKYSKSSNISHCEEYAVNAIESARRGPRSTQFSDRNSTLHYKLIQGEVFLEQQPNHRERTVNGTEKLDTTRSNC